MGKHRIHDVLGPVLLALALTMTACMENRDSSLLEALGGTWTATDAEGDFETVRFEPDRIVWNAGTESEYAFPYRLTCYQEEAGAIYIRFTCKRRTGSESAVAHLLTFTEKLDGFTMAHGEFYENVDAVFRDRKR